jgi:phosphoglycolate phosphatase-like HAD superfamily hydrolase
MPPEKPEKLILFDIDGTLLRAAGSGRAATERAMREIFGTVGGLATHNFSGKTDWHNLLTLLTPEGYSEVQIESALPQYDIAMARHMTEIVGDYNIHALPGARELVEALRTRDDVMIAILTGNMPQMARIKLQRAGFTPEDFAFGVYGSESPLRPDLLPIALQRAEQACGVYFALQDVIVIGDTADDIECAHSLGARVIAVATGWTPRADLEAHPPVTVIDNLADIEAVLNLILGR